MGNRVFRGAQKALILKQPLNPGDPQWLKQHLEVADVLEEMLCKSNFVVEVTQTLDRLCNDDVQSFDIIVPVWEYRGVITEKQIQQLAAAVRDGTGLAGVHGTMADSFRDCLVYHHMVGGQFVTHGPGNETYRVDIEDRANALTDGLKGFEVTSEKYYLHVDPSNHVLTTTRFGQMVMPVAWTRFHGKGRVFYCSVGHDAKTLRIPEAYTLVSRGLVWAAAVKGAGSSSKV